MRGKEFIEYDNPFDVGMTGLIGFASGYHAMMNCDALLMLGDRLPVPQFFPRTPRSFRSISGESSSAGGLGSTAASWAMSKPPSVPCCPG